MLEVKEFAWADMSPYLIQTIKFDNKSDNCDLIRAIKNAHSRFDESSRLYKLFHIALLYFQQNDLEYGYSVLLQTGKDCEWLFENNQRPRSYPLLTPTVDAPGWRRAAQAKCIVIDLECLAWNDHGFFYSESGIGTMMEKRHYYAGRCVAAAVVVLSLLTFSYKYLV